MSYLIFSPHNIKCWELLLPHFTEKDQGSGLHIHVSHHPPLPLPLLPPQHYLPHHCHCQQPRNLRLKALGSSFTLAPPMCPGDLMAALLGHIHTLLSILTASPTFPKLCSLKYWLLERGFHGQLTLGKTARYMLFSKSHNEH